MDARLNASAWTDETDDDQKARALIEATRDLEALSWVGTKASSTQALQWPRSWAPNPDASFGGTYYSDSEIPQRVKNATMELALEYLRAGSTDVAAIDSNQNVIEKTVDVLTTRYSEPYSRAQGINRYPRVIGMLRPLLASYGSSVPTVRG